MTLKQPKDPASPGDVQKCVNEYVAHLRRIADVFNEQAAELGLAVRLNPDRAIDAANGGTGIAKVIRFGNRADDSGVLHDAQLMTAIECIGELLTSPHHNGLVLGAMQSGKTTTSLALQFAGPIVYLLTGKCLYPIYLITSHTSQEDQTEIEITKFVDFYGELSVEVDKNNRITLKEYTRRSIDPVFRFAPTINAYFGHVLKRTRPELMVGPKLEDFIQRRAPGENIRRIADLCKRANGKGFTPLLIVDEPQFGASDRLVKVEEGQLEWRKCVLYQIFNKIDEALGTDASDRKFIGLSATPYELHDVNSVWKVKQYLTSEYFGFNYFGGKVIDAGANVTPPRTISFGDFGREIELKFLGKVSLNAYDNLRAFQRFAKKTGYSGDQFQYRKEVERTLRAVILHMISHGSRPQSGVCIRLFNNNSKSHRLLENLNLPNNKVEVIEYFGSDHKGKSVKRSLKERARSDLPFVIAVTNRARMGDAFPPQVEWFLEFSKKAADLNALLQGLLGRACGYGKKSTVIMSDENAQLVDDYKREQGGYIYKTSRHSLVTGAFRRGAPTNLIRLRRDMDDPVVKRFFDRIDQEVVQPHIIQGSSSLSTRRTKGQRGRARQFRTGPLLRIATEIELFDHLEKSEVRTRLFPTYPEFRIARAHDTVAHTRSPDRKLRYTMDRNGNCRFTFREWVEGTSNHGGVRSRGYGERDASDRGRAGDTLEPQVNMRKFDPSNGEFIDDKRIGGETMDRSQRRPGHWHAEMITLPLVAAVRERQVGDATYPVRQSPYSNWMSKEERQAAGFTK